MATTSSSLTATGSVTLSKPAAETLVVATIGGTYGTVTFVFEGSADGTNFFSLAAIRYDTGAMLTGTISPTDDAEYGYKIPSEGLCRVRARVTAIASGTVEFSLTSGSFVGQSLVTVNQTTASSYGASTFTGDVTLSGGSDILLAGTTGQTEIQAVDNLADALSVKIAGGNDLIVLKTTDSDEAVQLAANVEFTKAATLAAAGSVQGDAGAVVAQVTYVTAADGTKGVVLPAATAGRLHYIYNTHATSGLKVYPASGDDINDGSADAAVTIEGKTLGIFLALDTATWASIFTANS